MLSHRFIGANEVIARALPLSQRYWEPSRALGSMPSAAAILSLDCLEGGCLPRSSSATSACDNPAACARARCVSPRSLLKSARRRGEKSVNSERRHSLAPGSPPPLTDPVYPDRIRVQGGKVGIGANRTPLRNSRGVPKRYGSGLYGIASSP